MRFYYDLQGGNYVWHPDEDSAYTIGPEIAILFDREEGTLFKHGTPSLVVEKYKQLAAALRQIDSEDNLMVISGRIPIEKINHVIACSGICHRIFDEEIAKITEMQSAI